MKRSLFYLILLILVGYPNFTFSQATYPFSLYSFIFTDPGWNTDTLNYIHPELKDTNGLFNVYRGYKFTTPQYFTSYENINITSALSNDFPVIQQNRTLNFSIDTATSKTMSIYYKGQDTTTAIFIIPGSGINMSTSILNHSTNYHNLNCWVPYFCQNYGDVFLFVKPNEDYRAHWTNEFGYLRKLSELGIIQTLMGMGRPYAANYLVECNAMAKYLKQKYKKVIIIGLSQGGTAAMLTSLQSEPDAAYVASGYSTLFDNALPASNSNQIYFDSILTHYNSQVIKNTITAQNTDYLFGWNVNEGVYFSDYEVQTQATSLFFQGVPNIKSQTHYFYPGHHTFNCGAMDTLFRTTKLKPKSKITINDSVCTSDSAQAHIEFCGIPPYSFNLYKNDQFYQAYSSSLDTLSISLTENGIYQIKDLLDSNNITGFKSNKVQLTKDPIVGIQLSSQQFICDSNYSRLDFNLTGKSPWELTYSINGISQTVTLLNPSKQFQLQLDSLNILSILDSNLCTKTINSTYTPKDSSIDITLSSPQFNCDSNKTAIQFLFKGRAPWTLQYKRNGINQSLSTSNTNQVFYFQNGLYEFVSVQDSNNCIKPINQLFNFNYTPISVSASTPTYNCDSNKSQINFSFQGNAPFSLAYTQNGNPMTIGSATNQSANFFANGNYNFTTLTDATGCTANLNQSHNFNFDTVDITLSTPVYNCDSNKTSIQFNLQGNAPWTILYIKNGTPLQINTTNSSFTSLFTNGVYQFLSVTDATLCTKSINQVYTFNYSPLITSITQQLFDCDSSKYRIDFNLTSGSTPWTLSYHKVGGGNYTKTIVGNTASIWLDNGSWIIDQAIDNNMCVQNFNTPISVNYNTLLANISSSLYNCDSNKQEVTISLQGNSPWVINYMNTVTNTNYSLNSISGNETIWLNNGSYMFQSVTDATGCSQILNQSVLNNYTILSYQKTATNYHCDSNKIKIDFNVTGDGPWILNYKELNSNTNYQYISSSNNNSLFLPTGLWELVSISDIKCTKLIQDTIDVHFPKLTASLSSPMINCTSGEEYSQLNITNGLKPFTLHYNYNNQNLQYLTNVNNQNISLPNGTYYFEKLVDSVGCELALNQTFTTNYTKLNFVSEKYLYNCIDDSTSVQFTIEGINPLKLMYTINNQPLDSLTILSETDNWFSNGNYTWMYIKDDYGCVDSIQKTVLIENYPVSLTIDSITPNCQERKHEVQLSLTGKSPWTLYYNKLNVPDSIQFNTSSNNWSILPDNYFFNTIVDANQCSSDVKQLKSFPEFINFNPNLETNYTHLYLPENNLSHKWYQNNTLIDSLSKSKISVQGAGEYYVILMDSTGCEYKSNTVVLDFDQIISLYPNPAGNEVNLMVDDSYKDYWSYVITDAFGQKVQESTITQKLTTIQIGHLQAGTYSITVNYINDLGTHKKVLRLLKL